MRRPTVLVPLDRTMQLPLTLAGGLQTTFADLVSSPLPGRLAARVRRLQADRNERSGGGQSQQKRRAVEEKVPMAADNAYRAKARECLSLAECMNDPEERAEIVRFARMWMNLAAEPIDEAPRAYEFPRVVEAT